MPAASLPWCTKAPDHFSRRHTEGDGPEALSRDDQELVGNRFRDHLRRVEETDLLAQCVQKRRHRTPLVRLQRDSAREQFPERAAAVELPYHGCWVSQDGSGQRGATKREDERHRERVEIGGSTRLDGGVEELGCGEED